jgi:hypothetical protein
MLVCRALCAVVVAASVANCSGINAQTNAYATLVEARQAGAMQRGWVPEGLPPGTNDIHEAHVPGTPQRWGIINFPPSESEILRGLLQPDESSVRSERADAPGRIEWWPVALRGDIDAETLARAGITMYRAKQGDLVFAVNWKQGRAYYWTPAR